MIKKINVNDDKIIVVIASIEIEIRMYIFPIKNKQIKRKNIKIKKFIILIGIETIEEYINNEKRHITKASNTEIHKFPNTS